MVARMRLFSGKKLLLCSKASSQTNKIMRRNSEVDCRVVGRKAIRMVVKRKPLLCRFVADRPFLVAILVNGVVYFMTLYQK